MLHCKLLTSLEEIMLSISVSYLLCSDCLVQFSMNSLKIQSVKKMLKMLDYCPTKQYLIYIRFYTYLHYFYIIKFLIKSNVKTYKLMTYFVNQFSQSFKKTIFISSKISNSVDIFVYYVLLKKTVHENI